jgi:hypothetical protein
MSLSLVFPLAMLIRGVSVHSQAVWQCVCVGGGNPDALSLSPDGKKERESEYDGCALMPYWGDLLYSS